MLNYIKSCLLKQKDTKRARLIFITPLLVAIFGIMMVPLYYESVSFNVWGILFYPVLMTFISGNVIVSEKNKNFHGLFALNVNKEKLWFSQIITVLIMLLISTFIFVSSICVLRISMAHTYKIWELYLSGLILFISMSWQVPIWTFLSLKTNVVLSIIFSVFINAFSQIESNKAIFRFNPFSYPAKINTEILGILPNGLVDMSLKGFEPKNLILISVISILLFGILVFLTGKIFKKEEV